ncbi:hypothetical protein [Actinokineospora diospyrosa]|uniref:Uncharacterized protein n=1 Tax=Actinokineospora diospyrosa TaxID=103728 RepID=A0ABT1I879_9PSEU|nr:hypothetical protein [Actinokineospora diospyrosa]MCP2268789.1 hypothetical protein [Actinokineospora diospyrosa]
MTERELATVLELARRRGGGLVNVGHGRDPESTAAAGAFVAAWEGQVGQVGLVVSWPSVAASWLRQACRFAGGCPDLWVIADNAAEWVGMGRRLGSSAQWRANRTIAFAGLALPTLPDLVGDVEGLCGAGEDGSQWSFFDGELRWSTSRPSTGE